MNNNFDFWTNDNTLDDIIEFFDEPMHCGIIENLFTDISAFKHQISDLINENKSLGIRLQAAESKLNEIRDDYAHLELERDGLISEIKDWKINYGFAQDHIENICTQIDYYKSKLNEMAQIEPVGYMDPEAGHTVVMNKKYMVGDPDPRLIPVYAEKGAQSNADKVEIDKPARVAGRIFRVGASVQSVIEAAQRQYEAFPAPEPKEDSLCFRNTIDNNNSQ